MLVICNFFFILLLFCVKVGFEVMLVKMCWLEFLWFLLDVLFVWMVFGLVLFVLFLVVNIILIIIVFVCRVGGVVFVIWFLVEYNFIYWSMVSMFIGE